MNYENIYTNLINKFRIAATTNEYTERHHIVPDFFHINRKRKGPIGHLPGDPDSASNIVNLPPREHLFAHLLLCKIHKGTRYEYGCLASLTLMINISPHLINRTLFKHTLGKGYIYEKRKTEWSKKVSKQFKGTVVAKDMITNKIVGHVAIDHPNILSGRWAHHTKGNKLSKQHCRKISKSNSGLKNGKSKGYTDEQILMSYLKCSAVIGFLPHRNIWVGWATKNNEPYLLSFRPFRFNNKGFIGLRELAEERSGLQFDTKMYKRKDTKDIYNTAKLQWT
jgi:hypothetical protein